VGPQSSHRYSEGSRDNNDIHNSLIILDNPNHEIMKDPKRHKRRMVAPATRPAKPVVTVDTYREDPLYLRIRRIEAEILQDGRVVAPVDFGASRKRPIFAFEK
jgi:hypothetical protein